MGVILPGVDGTGFSLNFFMGLGREEINFCGSGTEEVWEFTPVSPSIRAEAEWSHIIKPLVLSGADV